MKKEELESLLGRGGDDVDLGLIEDHLRAVASERQLLDGAIAMCTARFEEAGPALRAILARAADGEVLSETEETLVFRGLYILGAARDSLACRPLLRLLRRPDSEVEHLLGDAITQSLARILAGVFDGDADALFGAIAERGSDEFIRDALLGAAAFLAWEGRIGRDRMKGFLERFYEGRLAADDDYAWIGWLQAVGLLGLRELAPLVHRAWDEGRIPSGVLDRGHFEKDLVDAERKPDDIDRFKDANLGHIDDVLVALDWTRLPPEGEGEEPSWADMVPDASAPVINPWRHVGRNDPCLCGSGKKAKKCCLAN